MKICSYFRIAFQRKSCDNPPTHTHNLALSLALSLSVEIQGQCFLAGFRFGCLSGKLSQSMRGKANKLEPGHLLIPEIWRWRRKHIHIYVCTRLPRSGPSWMQVKGNCLSFHFSYVTLDLLYSCRNCTYIWPPTVSRSPMRNIFRVYLHSPYSLWLAPMLLLRRVNVIYKPNVCVYKNILYA